MGSPETFADTKTYEEIAESTNGDVKTTFEDMDRAGSVASLMIWMGLIGLVLTAALSVGSLGQLTNSRLTTLAGGFAASITMLAPIVWYVLLPFERNVRLRGRFLVWVSLCLGGIHGRSNRPRRMV